MALFHLHMKPMGKTEKSGNIKNIAAAVAYRHCFKFDDFNYSNKKGFVDSFLMVPEEVIEKTLQGKGMDFFSNDPELKNEIKEKLEKGDVKSLWNTIQAQETRKDAQFCMEMQISLQHELSLEENIKNLKTLIHNHYISKGLCADVVLHNPDNNLHAHVMITQRQLESINVNVLKAEMPVEYTFSSKKLRDETFGRPTNEQLEPIRAEWANLCNASFEAAGLEARISHKTLEAQRQEALEAGDFVKAAELDRKPVKHIYRNESIQAQAEREVKAEQAERHNSEVFEKYDLQLEMVKMKVILPEHVVEPVLKPVIKTFEDALNFRKQERIKVIEENVKQYFKNRTEQLVRFSAQARAGARKLIHTIRTAAGKQRKALSNCAIIRSEQQARIASERLDNLLRSEQSNNRNNQELEKLHLHQQTKQVQKPVANTGTERKTIDIDKEIDNKIKPKLWYDPYEIPKYKPKWG